MPIEIDPRFENSGKRTRKRKRLRLIRRVGLVATIGLLGIGFVLGAYSLIGRRDVVESFAADNTGEEILIQSEETAEQLVILEAAAAEAFLDIRGEPMIINLPESASRGQKRLILDQTIAPGRAGYGDQLQLIDDLILTGQRDVQLTLPSSSADLAAFQSRRAKALEPIAALQEQAPVTEGTEVVVDADNGSWGQVLGSEAGTTVSYVETVIENTTTEAVAIQSAKRKFLFSEDVITLRSNDELVATLKDKGISAEELDRLRLFLEREAPALGLNPDVLLQPKAGYLIALRQVPDRPGAAILQLSLYSTDRFLISLSQPRPGRFERSADPWFEKDLATRAAAVRIGLEQAGEVRLKDAIYTAALRNGMPSELVGELLVMLSRAEDLDRIATRDDRLRVLYSAEENVPTEPAGKVLYVALSGSSNLKCYVVKPHDEDAPFGCFDPDAQLGGSGFIVPVAGTKTSGFGPRWHPIHQRNMNHKGVDWGAPTGTPIRATSGGRVSVAGLGGGYGNVVYIKHAGDVESRYAHLDAFADGIRAGVEVRRGQVIGYVGTTGNSTGPHLHFEIRVADQPVDPLSYLSGGSGAVEALVARIIQVESAGDARAKNSRSTATGLGQFINSTWLRMMRTYRPDLASSMSESELLELRFDPALSRAMVTNLARENEAFLQSRGHRITPGRLYLAHFLGPAGAHKALRADPNALVVDEMGASVVSANPFLDGKTVRWMTDWSDEKMKTVSTGRAAPSAPVPEPTKVKAYKAAIDGVLEGI